MECSKCTNCGRSVCRKQGEINKSKTGNFFCDRSCAAIYNNQKYPKRFKESKCKKCDLPIHGGYTYCKPCYENNHYLDNKTLEQAIKNRKDSNRYTGIRWNGRLVYRASNKPKCCCRCGYSKHYEICHIKAIKEFDLNSLVREINSIDNLIALCPNCHWELDNGLLKIGQEGLEPPISFVMSKVL